MKFFFQRKKQQLSKFDIGFLVASVALYCALTLGNMTRWSIWFDEGFSAYLMRFNIGEIARYTASDVHPPLYYWLLKLWVSVFGTSDLSLRLPSMIFIAASIVVVFFIIKRLFGVYAAKWVALLLALSPLLIRFGDEARMYGLTVLITALATLVLVDASERPTRKKWLLYGVLVSLGMWTHYFTAMVWLAHWAWRWLARGKLAGTKQYVSRDWIEAHALAIALFLPWLPFMVRQLTTIQGTGFWIPKVSVDSPVNTLTNTLLFLERGDAKGWLALLVFVIIVAAMIAALRSQKAITGKGKVWWQLVTVLAFLPPLLTFFASLPPLKSSYIDRYFIASTAWMIVLLGLLIAHTVHDKKWMTWILPVALVGALSIGVRDVYHYGNFNRNANPNEAQSVKQVIETIHKSDTKGTPIIADSAWRFYEAIQYNTSEHPVYFIAQDDLVFGSYDMLRFSDAHKIKDLDEFRRMHPTVWYLYNWYNDDERLPEGEWSSGRAIVGPTPVKGSSMTRARLIEAR